MEAIKNGVKGSFSDTDWASGQPQRYGWQEIGKEKKELPKEIIKFIERRKAEPAKIKDSESVEFNPILEKATSTLIENFAKKALEDYAKEQAIKVVELGPAPKKEKKVTKPKTKSNDNPKQKVRATAKRKPGGVAKN